MTTHSGSTSAPVQPRAVSPTMTWATNPYPSVAGVPPTIPYAGPAAVEPAATTTPTSAAALTRRRYPPKVDAADALSFPSCFAPVYVWLGTAVPLRWDITGLPLMVGGGRVLSGRARPHRSRGVREAQLEDRRVAAPCRRPVRPVVPLRTGQRHRPPCISLIGNYGPTPPSHSRSDGRARRAANRISRG